MNSTKKSIHIIQEDFFFLFFFFLLRRRIKDVYYTQLIILCVCVCVYIYILKAKKSPNTTLFYQMIKDVYGGGNLSLTFLNY